MSLLRALSQKLQVPRPAATSSRSAGRAQTSQVSFRDGFEVGPRKAGPAQLGQQAPSNPLLIPVPASCPLGAHAPAASTGVTHVVRAGESLVSIAEGHLGEGADDEVLWDYLDAICALNGIADARNLYTGEPLLLPPLPR